MVAECVKLSDVYGDTAIKSLDVFPQTEAKNALINIVNATVNSWHTRETSEESLPRMYTGIFIGIVIFILE